MTAPSDPSPKAGSREGLVSVIIPNFNCARWLPQVIESCFEQGPALKEVIVVDDGSSDDSMAVLAELCARYGDRLVIASNPEKGANTARNFGFTKSSGRFIQWLDSDDFLLPGKFEAQLAAFDVHPSADVVYSDWYEDTYVPDTGERHRRARPKAAYADFRREILKDNWSVPANYLFRRETAEWLHKIRAWNPVRRVAQDREYVTLAALHGAAFIYTPGFFSIYNRWNPHSLSSMPFAERLDHQLDLEETFRDEIDCSNLTPRLRREYKSLLNAHILNACYYNPALTIRKLFWIGNVDYSVIHYKKRVVIPLVYLWQVLKFAFSARRRPPAEALSCTIRHRDQSNVR